MSKSRKDAIRRHGSVAEAARKEGTPPSTLRHQLKKAEHDAIAGRKGSKGLKDFRSLFDKSFIIPNRIREGLKNLGPNGWEYEAQFAKASGVSLADLSAYRDEFAEYIVVVNRDGRRAWAGSPKLAQSMREMVK